MSFHAQQCRTCRGQSPYNAPLPTAPTPIAQNADIRYLGRLLGDVIRAYGGDALFERIEYIRAASVDRYRGIAGAAAIDRGPRTR